MNKFIKELRRREVFRTGGLYVGVAWILIEAASIVLPTFDVPEWVFKALLITAFVGFPIALILAWFYDVTDHGVVLDDEEHEAAGSAVSGRLMDFVVIGVLAIALSFSVYLNINSGPAVPVVHEPVSVLIANFDNQTGDPLFDNSLEQALNIGLEAATFITVYRRPSAARALERLKPGSVLDEAGARLVAIREGIQLVVSGSVVPDGNGYDLSARMINPEDGSVIAESSVNAKDKLGVLGAMTTLAEGIREELGDESVGDADSPLGETFTAASLESVKYYTEAQNLAASQRYDEAIPFYEQAIAADGRFGRAYSGWALALFYLGRVDQATALWERALTEMDSMTERERFRTLGLYYVAVAGDYKKAVESYQTLVDKYPADNTGHNNMAISYYFMLDFQSAMESAAKGLAIYPTNMTVKSNYAIFAMLAGDFEVALKTAEEILAEDPGLWKAWLPIAMARLAAGDLADAEQAYGSMAKSSERGVPFANLGLADIAMFDGAYAKAVELLEAGVSGDVVGGNQRQLGRKYIALAEARSSLGDLDGASEALRRGLELHQGNGQLVPAALVSLEIRDKEYATNIAEQLSQALQPDARSFGRVIEGAIATQEGRHADAVDALRSGIELSDSWLLRFHLGRAYYAAGRYVEALDEFELCQKRRGETTAMFQEDDEPTWRYMARLKVWQQKAREKLGMSATAQ